MSLLLSLQHILVFLLLLWTVIFFLLDARERFHYLVLLLVIAMRNLTEYEWNFGIDIFLILKEAPTRDVQLKSYSEKFRIIHGRTLVSEPLLINFILKNTPTAVFSFEFCERFKIAIFTEQFRIISVTKTEPAFTS